MTQVERTGQWTLQALGMFVKLVLLAAAISAAAAVDYYHTIDDGYDASNATPEEMAAMFDCLSDTGPCSELGANFRQFYPEIIVQACARCSPLMKQSMCKHMKKAMQVVPDRFQVFRERHDPEGIYFDKFLASLTGC